MKQYFTGCRTQEELKKRYRELCKALHPDNGGDAEAFKAMQAEFIEAGKTEAWHTFTNSNGEQYHRDATETAEEFASIINALAALEGVQLEICGSWLWISGNTYPYRETIKNTGAKFSRNKTAWYFHKEPFRKRSKKTLSMDDIRAMFGAESINQTQDNKLTAAAI